MGENEYWNEPARSSPSKDLQDAMQKARDNYGWMPTPPLILHPKVFERICDDLASWGLMAAKGKTIVESVPAYGELTQELCWEWVERVYFHIRWPWEEEAKEPEWEIFV